MALHPAATVFEYIDILFTLLQKSKVNKMLV